LGRKFLHLLFAPVRNENSHEHFKPHDHPHPAETITQYILLGLVLYCGLVQPQFLLEYIQMAVNNLTVK
jgi:hypothetical protein